MLGSVSPSRPGSTATGNAGAWWWGVPCSRHPRGPGRRRAGRSRRASRRTSEISWAREGSRAARAAVQLVGREKNLVHPDQQGCRISALPTSRAEEFRALPRPADSPSDAQMPRQIRREEILVIRTEAWAPVDLGSPRADVGPARPCALPEASRPGSSPDRPRAVRCRALKQSVSGGPVRSPREPGWLSASGPGPAPYRARGQRARIRFAPDTRQEPGAGERVHDPPKEVIRGHAGFDLAIPTSSRPLHPRSDEKSPVTHRARALTPPARARLRPSAVLAATATRSCSLVMIPVLEASIGSAIAPFGVTRSRAVASLPPF